MGRIKVLDSLVADMIAAGEVVERPASVVKELAENAIDAGAGRITVEILKGGIELIRVTDDGSGFAPDDLPTAFLRHATSKISSAEDLYNIHTMGFRGEALASIAAVSKTEVITKQKDDDFGTYLKISAGDVEDLRETGCPDGTTMTVRNLFYNVPARMKFLKKDSAEGSAAYDTVVAMALGHPEVSFRFISDGREKLHTPGDGDLKSCIYSVYGQEYTENIKELSYSEKGVTVSGFCGNGTISRSTRGYQTFFVNGRVIKSRSITYSLEQGYQDAIMKGKYPFAVIRIEIDPMLCDVNVHPAKTEVRFSDERLVTSAVYWAVKNAIFRVDKYVPAQPEESEKIPEVSLPTRLSEPEFIPPVKEEKKDIKPPAVYKISKPEAKVEKSPEKTVADIPEIAVQPAVKPEAKVTVIPDKEPEIFEQKTFIEKDENKAELKIIGQLFDTYIVAQEGDELVLIDQHAAHERINFEKLKAERDSGVMPSQTLLSPIVLKFTASEHEDVMSNIDSFRDLGFDIDDFGGNSVIIRSAPVVSEKVSVDSVFREILPIVCSVDTGRARGEAESEALYSLACHSSVRANKVLSVAEMKALCDELGNIPGTCPHGRPVKVTLSKKDIEKMFKRIV